MFVRRLTTNARAGQVNNVYRVVTSGYRNCLACILIYITFDSPLYCYFYLQVYSTEVLHYDQFMSQRVNVNYDLYNLWNLK